jgi:hypothetical protein
MQLKDDENPKEFMKKFKMKMSEATTAGLAHDDEERTFILLNALPPKYSAVSLTLSATKSKLEMREIETLLVNEYQRTQRSNKQKETTLTMTAMFV